MEFFGYTLLGPQNYMRNVMRDYYHEPLKKEEVQPLMEKVLLNSTMPKQIERPDVDTVRFIDCYIGQVNGFAYGSSQRFMKMKRKGVIKTTGPSDIYKLPATSSVEYGWWHHDPSLATTTWHHTYPRWPQPTSPNSHILDVVRKNNKYATLF